MLEKPLSIKFDPIVHNNAISAWLETHLKDIFNKQYSSKSYLIWITVIAYVSIFFNERCTDDASALVHVSVLHFWGRSREERRGTKNMWDIRKEKIGNIGQLWFFEKKVYFCVSWNIFKYHNTRNFQHVSKAVLVKQTASAVPVHWKDWQKIKLTIYYKSNQEQSLNMGQQTR